MSKPSKTASNRVQIPQNVMNDIHYVTYCLGPSLSAAHRPPVTPVSAPPTFKIFEIFAKNRKFSIFFQKSYFGPKSIKTHFLDTLKAQKGVPHPYIVTNPPKQHHQTRRIRKNVKKSKIFDFFTSHNLVQNR